MKNITKIPQKRFSGFRTSFFGILNITLVAIYIFLSLQMVTSGGKLASLEKKKSEITKKNEELNFFLLESNSLISLSNKSSELGFFKPEKTIYLGTEDLVANVR